MRKTTVNVSESLDEKIAELQRLTDQSDFIRVIEAAVYNYLRMVKSSGSYSPIYTLDKVWIDADKTDEESNTLLVDSGYDKSRIRKAANYEELLERQRFYVQVKADDLTYPYAKYDYEEVKPSADDSFWKFVEMVGITPDNWQPNYFQQAALVTVPKAGLI
jgi:hypothetical protein